MKIRDATSTDSSAIAAIYRPFVLETTVSFEETAPSAADMAQRIAETQAAGFPWLVIEENNVLRGYAYATKWRVRHAYRFSAESTVYLAAGNAGRGLGAAIYSALLARLREQGLHSVMGGICQPNPASVALHEKLGFQKVAHFKEVGFKFGQWLDVGYWELHL